MEFIKGDLHLHTHNSDGKDTLESLKAKIYSTGGNKVVSITDHHYMTTKKVYEENNVLWIPGIEISAMANGQSIHITGYGLEPKFSPKLEGILQHIIDGYNSRGKQLYYRLVSLGYSLPPFNEFRDPTLPPPMYKSDFVKQIGKILGTEDSNVIRQWARDNGNLFFVEEENFMPDVQEIIPAMHESNMIACRAHPGKKLFRNTEERDLSMQTLDYIVNSGIDGIEPFAHKHTKEQTDFFIIEAHKRNLLMTGGSDYHGDSDHSIGYPLSQEIIENFLGKLGYK